MSGEEITPIGHIFTPYKQKFAIPRQPGLVKAARGYIRFASGFEDPNCIRELEQFSHLWLIFKFHHNQGWSPLVRPPRLGGNQKTGVFATRSSFRPNGLGLSVVELIRIQPGANGPVLEVAGMDLLDGTPLYDIKPYVPYADSHPNAQGGFAQSAPETLEVRFSDASSLQLSQLKDSEYLQQLIQQVLAQDPRPAYHQNDPERIYAMHLDQYNIRFKFDVDGVTVVDISLYNSQGK